MSTVDHHDAATGKPPTANTLAPKERTELVKKARKLQEMLGVPMHVVDATTSTISPPPAATASPITPTNATEQSSPVVPPARKRTKSLKKRKGEDAKEILIAMSTAVHVETTSVNTPIESEAAFTPMPPRSPGPFTTSRPTLKPPPRPLRSKRSLVVARKANDDSLVQLPVLQLTPLTITDSAFNTPTRRPSSIASISTFNSSSTNTTNNLYIQFPGVSSDVTNEKRRFSLPPSPKSSSVDSFPNLPPTPTLSAEALRQRHIIMSNKLHRHFGELIPPELLINQGPLPSSPMTPTSSPVEVPSSQQASASNTSPTSKKSHKHSRSLWAGLTNKRSNSTISKPLNVPSPASSAAPSRSPSRTRSPIVTASQPMQPPRTAALERAHQYATYHQRDASSSSSDASEPSEGLLPYMQPQQPDWMTTLNTIPMASTTEEKTHKQREAMESRDAAFMSAREKSLRVRRAAKMAQKFGETPPQALFHQITNTAPSSGVDASEPFTFARSTGIALNPYPHSYGRHGPSRASSLSVSITPSVHSSENDVPGGRRARSTVRSGSVKTKSRRSSVSSTVHTKEERNGRSMDVKMPMPSSSPSVGDDNALPSITMTAPKSPVRVTLPTTPISPAVSDSSCTSTSTTKENGKGVYSPKTPASFATLFSPPPTPISTPAGKPISPLGVKRSQSHSFTSRRRQATKLTQFFGVDYPDLYQAMVIDNPTTIMNNQSPDPEQPEQPPPSPSSPAAARLATRTMSLSRDPDHTHSPSILTQQKRKLSAPAPAMVRDSIRTTFEIVSNNEPAVVTPLVLRRQSASGSTAMLSKPPVVLKSGTWGRPRDPEDVRVVMNKLRELKA
ncbi:hypothetical protein FRB96_007712 [Tulasnella sp. 330]|nr:hypothetical protein FRB96_007712 [Tulasnella sp. 330]KAG8870800.1 hypothetical protein FRB97_009364 [Tulasnella sp. 331]KAG8873179.1 hypothetical protein FRB98_009170 [Tulasnella sp. 332]